MQNLVCILLLLLAENYEQRRLNENYDHYFWLFRSNRVPSQRCWTYKQTQEQPFWSLSKHLQAQQCLAGLRNTFLVFEHLNWFKRSTKKELHSCFNSCRVPNQLNILLLKFFFCKITKRWVSKEIFLFSFSVFFFFVLVDAFLLSFNDILNTSREMSEQKPDSFARLYLVI